MDTLKWFNVTYKRDNSDKFYQAIIVVAHDETEAESIFEEHCEDRHYKSAYKCISEVPDSFALYEIENKGKPVIRYSRGVMPSRFADIM